MELIFIMLSVFFLGATVYSFYSLWIAGDYSTHKKMTINFSDSFGYAKFEDFIREFKNIQWQKLDNFPGSFFQIDTDSEIHASIIKFNGKGMVLSNAFEYKKFKHFMKELAGSNKKSPTIDWNQRCANDKEKPKSISIMPSH